MKKPFAISYAYDVPRYADFVLEAESEADALRIAQSLLDAGILSDVLDGLAEEYDNVDSPRVFLGDASNLDHSETLEAICEHQGATLPDGWRALQPEQPATPAPTPASIAADPAASFWLKNAMAGALVRDPLDALRDAETLLAVMRQRWHAETATEAAPVAATVPDTHTLTFETPHNPDESFIVTGKTLDQAIERLVTEVRSRFSCIPSELWSVLNSIHHEGAEKDGYYDFSTPEEAFTVTHTEAE